MSATSGIAGEVLGLPSGGGAVQGLGETFRPDFHTGTGSYAIPLDLPNGPGDIGPKLTLLYSTTSGNGPFGMGFDLHLHAIGRSSDKRVPAYTDSDPLVLLGGGELVAIGDGAYRLRTDTAGWLVHRDGDGFTLTDQDGKRHRLGTTEKGRIQAVEDGRVKVFRWLLEEIEDPVGNRAQFTWTRDGGQCHLAELAYGPYTVRFSYETRPDPLIDGRAGFVVTTRLRCSQIELHTADGSASPLTRRWTLGYEQSTPGGHSLLREVRLTGVAADGATLDAPVLKLGYTEFRPRRLTRFTGSRRGEAPGALSGRRELVDWDGDGLPDLLELGGGRARLWRNQGDGTWAPPTRLAPLPVPVALDQPGTAFADMNGDGTADLLMLDRRLNGFYPLRPGGGFTVPRFFRRSPDTLLADPDARLMDLDADGIADLLVTGPHAFLLYLRDHDGGAGGGGGPEGWARQPIVVARGQAPPVAFRDPRVHVADMNGDGLPDLVRVGGGGVTYWPYLGRARWGEPITLANPPTLPPRADPERILLADLDGDGCADLVYLDTTGVRFWLNQGGTQLAPPQAISNLPATRPDAVRLADMQGTGTAGLLWSVTAPGGRTTDFHYLDFTGATKPYLLDRIDNGLGLVTEISYAPSTTEAVRDRRAGRPWPTFLPFPVPLVTGMRVRDAAGDRDGRAVYRYHDGHFDGVRRELCGFRQVEVDELGDDACPTLRTRNTYHLGLDPADPGRPLPAAERDRLRALRGKLLVAEVFGLDGSPDEQRPYLRTENSWRAEVTGTAAGIELVRPRLEQTRTFHYERRPDPFRVLTTRNLAVDANGNVTDREELAQDPRDPTLDRGLRTATTFVTDPTGRFRRKPARTVQRDTTGVLLATTISYYDGLPEGQIGPEGLLTRQESLALPDALVTEVYGPTPPDLAALGYHRRAGEDGWWIDEARYTRTDDPAGLRGTITSSTGVVVRVAFDPQRCHPVQLTDSRGNAVRATFSYRANQLETLTDASGATITNRYDPLGRLAATVEPGATADLPTILHRHHIGQVPALVETEQRAVDGQPGTIRTATFRDGAGQLLEERAATGMDEVILRTVRYNARGMVREQWLPRAATGPGWSPPGAAHPHIAYRYDALGRLVELRNADGTARRQRFEPGVTFIDDEEDLRTGPGATHTGTPTRTAYDPTGRILEVALDDAHRLVRTRYAYDAKGNLVAVTEPGGQRTEIAYDLLGRRLRTRAPASGTTIFIVDPSGNLVEKRDARNERVTYTYDDLGRLLQVTFPATGQRAAAYTYHDTNGPPPPEAGPFTRGRLVSVTHQGGTETYAYDPLGRVTHKTVTPADAGTGPLPFDFTYRADGQRDTITYPPPAPGASRRVVRYEYDSRGLLLRIPSYVRRVDHDPAGRRTRVEHANDVVTAYTYQPDGPRLTDLVTTGPGGVAMQDLHYEYDHTGNLVTIVSADPAAAGQFTYDDLYRLRQTTSSDGDTQTCTYDDLGNLTSKSGVGSYTYDAAGRLATAGPDSFTSTAAGQIEQAPWGATTYDPMGRLAGITRGPEQQTYQYDHDGNRARIQRAGAGSHDLFLVDDLLTIERDGGGGLTWFAHVMDGGARVAQIRLNDGATSWLHPDHLGSTMLVTAADGHVVQSIRYDAYGDLLEVTVEADANAARHLHTGALWDGWAGLTHLHARAYAPRLGRFISPDTLVGDPYDPRAWNRYAYAVNNPLRYADPTGHFWEEIGQWFADNWKYVVAAVVVVALLVLSIVTFGATAALAGVIIGMVIGGVVGGIAAAQAGGDILLGVLVGMAIGGAAAFAGAGIGAGFAAAFGKGLVATLAAGTLSGAVSGAAMGFVAGWAGGAGDWPTIFDRMWKGALIGAITGFAFSLASYGFQHGWFTGPKVELHKPSLQEVGKAAETGAANAAKEIGQQANAGALTPGSAASSTAQNIGSEIFKTVVRESENGYAVLTPLLGASFAPAWAVGITTTSSGLLVLDWADDLWRLAVGTGLVKYQKSGTF